MMKKKIQSIIAAFILSVSFGTMALAPVTYAACSDAITRRRTRGVSTSRGEVE